MEFNKENMIQMIHGKKKFFLKSFLISVVLFILSVVVIMLGQETWADIAYKVYNIDLQIYPLLVGILMGLWKILIIQFTLVPFMALACIEKCMKKSEEKAE